MGSFARELIKHVPWIRFALERNVCQMHTCTYTFRNMRRSWWSYRPSTMQNKSPNSNSRKTLQPWEHHTRPDSLLWRGPELVEHILLVMLKLVSFRSIFRFYIFLIWSNVLVTGGPCVDQHKEEPITAPVASQEQANAVPQCTRGALISPETGFK